MPHAAQRFSLLDSIDLVRRANQILSVNARKDGRMNFSGDMTYATNNSMSLDNRRESNLLLTTPTYGGHFGLALLEDSLRMVVLHSSPPPLYRAPSFSEEAQ